MKITSLGIVLVERLSLVDNEHIQTSFVKTRVAFAGDEAEFNNDYTMLCYADTKEVIANSRYYEEHIFADIPGVNVDRELAVCVVEPVTFKDNEPESYAAELSAWGVLTDDEGGYVQLEKQLTRAEALTMLVRFMGISATVAQDHQYQDVSKSDWYYDDLQAALQYKLVADGSRFNADSPMTRQEFMVLLERALDRLGWLKPLPEALREQQLAGLLDADQISDFARAAYQHLAYNKGVFAYTDQLKQKDVAYWEQYLYPQQAITKYVVVDLLYDAKLHLSMDPGKSAIAAGLDWSMPEIKCASAYYPLVNSLYDWLFSYYGRDLLPTDESNERNERGEIYQSLISGAAEVVFDIGKLEPELLQAAAAAGGELALIKIAYEAPVFYTQSDNPITGLTQAQLRDIYAHHAYPTWRGLGGADVPLRAFCCKRSELDYWKMEQAILRGQPMHEAVNVAFPLMTMLMTIHECCVSALDRVEPAKEYALGYTPLSDYHIYLRDIDLRGAYGDAPLKLLAVDGIMPTVQTIKDGSYPLSDAVYLVLHQDAPLQSPARKLAAYLLSADGQNCLQAAGLMPL